MRSWLRSIRENKAMTEKQVAASVGISQPAYHAIENGNRNPSVPTAQRISQVLGFDWTIFFPMPNNKKQKGA